MPTSPIAAEVYALAAAARMITNEIQEYAEALDLDDSLYDRLADQHVGAPTVVQILQEVTERTRRPSFDRFHRTLATEFANAQAGRT